MNLQEELMVKQFLFLSLRFEFEVASLSIEFDFESGKLKQLSI